MATAAPVALVTGASAGFGWLIAEALARAGYRVYGTSRQSKADGPAGVFMRALELTDPASITACVEGIVSETGRIDLLVNNAGRFHEGLLEETPLSEVDLLFRTNFLGAVAVNNAVLPFMRRARAGRIVMIGSLAGLAGIPGMGYTSAVKHALEGYAEALRGEIAGFGVHVSLVEPSYFRTDIYDRRIETEARPRFADYDALRATLGEALLQDSQKGDDPAKVAALVVQIAASPRPRLRYPVGADAGLIWRLKRYMPEAMFLRGLYSRTQG